MLDGIHSFTGVCIGCYVILLAHGCKAQGLLPSFVYITFGRVLQGCCLFSFSNLLEVAAFEKAKRLVYDGEMSSLSLFGLYS